MLVTISEGNISVSYLFPDGSNTDAAPPTVTDIRMCNKPYNEVEDFEADYINLVATCQRHTRY